MFGGIGRQNKFLRILFVSPLTRRDGGFLYMDYIMVVAFLYAVLLLVDLFQAIKKKQWKTLKFSVPIYIITFIMNIMIGLGFQFTSPNAIIKNMIQLIYKG